jgi:hypothetical protein
MRGPDRPNISSKVTYDALSEEPLFIRALLALVLEETRRFISGFHARMMVVFFAILYAFGSMTFGGMLILTHVQGGFTTEVIWGNALGQGAWNYPGLLIVAPWGVVSLPLLATFAMGIVSVGVGIGITVAILISYVLLRDRRRAGTQAGAVGSVAGLTPAMIALVTLGACCSTTAAATAGVGLVAQASGSTINNLLVNNWYLDVFQVAVIFVALLAQELILRVYGGLFGLTSFARPTVVPRPRASGSRALVGGMLRAALLLGGLTWGLAVLAEWATSNPGPVTAPLVLGLSVAVALVPGVLENAVDASRRGWSAVSLRVALLVAGVSLVGWMPPPIAASGAAGFVNELFGAIGLSAAWGAVPPVLPIGVALFLRWGVQILLLGGFAIAFALAPAGALRPILCSVARTGGVVAPSTRDGAPSDRWAPGGAPTHAAPIGPGPES